MSRYMRVSAFLLLAVVAAATSVVSAEEIVTRDGSRFQVAHNYWRDHLARHRNAELEFWPDAETFPSKILVYMDGRWEEITNPRRINCGVTLTILRSVRDWRLLKYCMLDRHWYNVHLAAHGQYPASDPKIISDMQKIDDNCSYPLKISFDSNGYRYSDYDQLTLNRNTVWRIWLEDEDYKRSDRTGGQDDLFRELRSKLFGVFGLYGAQNAPQNCLTVASTNPYYAPNNIQICDSEREALQMLLFGPSSEPLPPKIPDYPPMIPDYPKPPPIIPNYPRPPPIIPDYPRPPPDYPKPNFPGFGPTDGYPIGYPNIPASPPRSPIYNYPRPPFPPPQDRYPIVMSNQAYARIGVPHEIYEGFESAPWPKTANFDVDESDPEIDKLKDEFVQR